jgi:WD40 repeat protein
MPAQNTLTGVCLLLFSSLGAWAATPAGPGKDAKPRVDRYGDPLPEHALLKIGTTRLRPNVTNSGSIRAMAFTNEGTRLVLLTERAGVQVWDLASGTLLLQFGNPANVGGAAFALAADGSRAAVVEAKDTCRIYDTTTGKPISTAVGDWYGLNDLRFSPDNRLLGAAYRGATAVWEVAGGRKVWQVPFPPDSRFGAFAFAPTGKMVIFAPRAGTKPPDDPREEHPLPLLLFDILKGPKSEWACPIAVTSARNLLFSPDGKTLAAEKSGREFVVWDFATGKLLHEPRTEDDTVWCMRFSPDGKRLVTGSNHGRVRLWDLATGELRRKFSSFETTILSLAFSPDGKRVAASASDGTLRVWEVDSGKEVFDSEGHRMRNVQARFAGDDQTIVSICGFNPVATTSADERTFRYWDAATGKSLKKIELARKDFLPFCLSGDARVLFVIDGGKITKKLLAGDKTEDVKGLPPNYYVYLCSADGRYLAAHTDDFWGEEKDGLVKSNFLKVVDTATGKQVLAYEGSKGEKFCCRFTEDGRYLAVHSFHYVTDGMMGSRSSMELKETFLTVWDVQTGQKTSDSKLLLRARVEDFQWPSGVVLSPGRDLALSRGKDGVELHDLVAGTKIAQLSAGGWQCESWAFSRDGKFVAVGDEQGQIVLWSVFSRTVPPKVLATLVGHKAAVTSVHFSSDGARLLSGSDDTTILLWDVAPWTAPLR